MPWGSVIGLPAAPTSPWVFDRDGELIVRMSAGEPESATESEVLNGANLGALIDTTNNTAEIIHWVTATDNGGGVFTLTTLLRGKRGTEDLIASRGIGNLFVVLDDLDYLVQFSDTTSSASATRYLRFATLYSPAALASPTVTKTTRGRAEKPWAPVHVAGSRDGSDNLTITWVRRSRLAGEDFPDGSEEIPLGEATEAYEVDIVDSGVVVRTIGSLTAETATYSAANQTTDGLTPGDPVTVRVYQISATVGRGIAAEATI
jgi:hypothetical protein